VLRASMSAPTDRLQDPRNPPLDAARWARAARAGQQPDAAPKLVPDEPPRSDRRPPRLPSVESHPFPVEGDPAIQRLRARRSLDPAFCPAPPVHLRRRSWLSGVSRLALVILAAAVVALIAIGQFPFLDFWHQPGTDRAVELATASTRPASSISVKRAEPALPRLTVQESRGTSGEPAPLGVALQGRIDGAVVMVTGLLSGMTLSMGGAVGADAWQVPAADLASTWILPPKDFVGAADLVAELRPADDTIADRRPIHLEWRAAVASAAPTPPHLDREEIANLVKRGEDFIATGDLAAARLVLQRAAEADDAQAALALAATYDPFVLRELKVYGFSGDVATARAWYEKAKEFGSAEAPRRLEILASGAR
jgi:hypothetical protein